MKQAGGEQGASSHFCICIRPAVKNWWPFVPFSLSSLSFCLIAIGPGDHGYTCIILLSFPSFSSV